MSFAKESQTLPLEGTDIIVGPLPPFVSDRNELREPSVPSLEDIVVGDDEDEETHIHVGPEEELVLTLDKIPGALDQEDIAEAIEVDEPEEVTVSDDPWDWGGKALSFLPWLSKMMQNVPGHTGKDTVGLERAIAYFEALDRSISKAVRTDLNNEIAIDAVEKARDEIQRGIERLEERLDQVKSSKYPKKKTKKKKSEEEQDGLVKEAQKATHVGGIVVSVPLLISGLARVCINGMVSAGHDIEYMFQKLSKKFDLTKREQFELVQLLQDMNYPVRRDRGFLLDEEIDTTSSDGFDWNANYPA